MSYEPLLPLRRPNLLLLGSRRRPSSLVTGAGTQRSLFGAGEIPLRGPRRGLRWGAAELATFDKIVLSLCHALQIVGIGATRRQQRTIHNRGSRIGCEAGFGNEDLMNTARMIGRLYSHIAVLRGIVGRKRQGASGQQRRD